MNHKSILTQLQEEGSTEFSVQNLVYCYAVESNHAPRAYEAQLDFQPTASYIISLKSANSALFYFYWVRRVTRTGLEPAFYG